MTGFVSTPTAVVRLPGVTVDGVNVDWQCWEASSLRKGITGGRFDGPVRRKGTIAPSALLFPGAGVCPQHGRQGSFRRDIAKRLVEAAYVA